MKSTFVLILLLCVRILKIYCAKEQADAAESSTWSKILQKQRVDTGSTSNEITIESADQQIQPSMALKLIKKRKHQGFAWPFERANSKQMQRGDTLVNVCPAESPEHSAIVKVRKFQYCLFVRDESKTASLEDRICEKYFEPTLWQVQDDRSRCGENGRATLYTYIHQLCWKSKNMIAKFTMFDSKIKDEIFPKIEENYIEVYTACWLFQTETVYVRYTFVPAITDDQLEQAFKPHELQTQNEGFANLEFGKQPDIFNIDNQRKSLKNMFGNDFDEYLIPQRLISPAYITPLLAKRSLHSYLNVGPQWSSMKDKWLQLEEYIWSLGIKSPNTIFIYAGTHGKITKDGNELRVKIDKSLTFSVPSVWWKLIMNKDYEEGIVIAMQNEPKNFNNLGAKLCENSVCNSSGWEKIDGIAYCCEFNDEMKKLLNLDEEEIMIKTIFNPKIEIESKPKPKYKPSKPESKLKKLFKRILKRKPKDII